jgi:hypothetical protein
MRRLCVLLGVLLLVPGCASESARRQWDEALRDLRGDNMQMRGGAPAVQNGQDRPPTSPRD